MSTKNFKNKPRKCPECGSISIASILYGMPFLDEKLQADLDNGRVVLGGCCRTDNDPVWKCNSCGIEFYRLTGLDSLIN